MGSTRDLIISFVEGSCEDRNRVYTQAGLVDKVWLACRPPELSRQRVTQVSAFRLSQDMKACRKNVGPKTEPQSKNLDLLCKKSIECPDNVDKNISTSKENKVTKNELKYAKSKCPSGNV